MLVLGDNGLAASTAALSNIETLMKPRNFSFSNRNEFEEFLTKFRVGSVLIANNRECRSFKKIEDTGLFSTITCKKYNNFYILHDSRK